MEKTGDGRRETGDGVLETGDERRETGDGQPEGVAPADGLNRRAALKVMAAVASLPILDGMVTTEVQAQAAAPAGAAGHG